MDNKALYNLSYGVFLLSTNADGKKNACITNTCIQAAASPARLAISVNNGNYTCELIKKSGTFALSVLDTDITFPVIEHFGMQSGRDVDKLAGKDYPEDGFGNPYLDKGACAMFSAKVTESHDLGTHTLFVAEIIEAEVISDKSPITYADYQQNIKPRREKMDETREIVAWRCKICGYVFEGAELPADYTCPLCMHPAEDFEPVYKD